MRLLTDPTFDPSCDYPGPMPLRKLTDATVTADDLGVVNAVLLSHDEHMDNLDIAGRAYLQHVPLTLTTVSGAGRLGGTARGLAPWTTVALQRPDGRQLTVTATPALHGPEGAEEIAGEVVGFVLTADDMDTVYISGDNASLDVVRQVADRFEIDIAILFAGAVRPPFFGGEPATLDAQRAVEATRILDPHSVVIAHVDEWSHFEEDLKTAVAVLEEAGFGERLQRR